MLKSSPNSRRTDWFERVFGFRETGGYDRVKSKFVLSSYDNTKNGRTEIFLSTIDKKNPRRTFYVGPFETPNLSDLRSEVAAADVSRATSSSGGGKRTRRSRRSGLTFRNVVGSADELHRARANGGAVFQAASQFNCLEMIGPNVTPGMGITRYINDRTQGPVCAMACPAGTVYRNYFAEGEDEDGGGQLDMLKDVGVVLGNYDTSAGGGGRGNPVYWKMHNGYALSAERGSIRALSQKLRDDVELVENAMEQLRVGIHWNTEVDKGLHDDDDDDDEKHVVTQVYCSALPLTYDRTALPSEWETFARAILDASYEATLAVAAVLAEERGERTAVYLTMLGGGAFGNETEWIRRAIERALVVYRERPLDVYLVHYRELDRAYEGLAFDT